MSAGSYATQNGKEMARWNATRHGIRSPAPVVPGVEKPEDWEEYRDGMLEDLGPSGSLELALAERVALLSWRLHRVTRYETETIARSQERVVEDLRDRRSSGFGYGHSSRGPAHPEDALAVPKEARRTERRLKRFPHYPDDKKLSGSDAAAVLWAVAGRVEDEADLEELELPGVPDW